jgi:hypothetical protein
LINRNKEFEEQVNISLNRILQFTKDYPSLIGCYSKKTIDAVKDYVHRLIELFDFTKIGYLTIGPGDEDEIEIENNQSNYILDISITGKDELSGLAGRNKITNEEILLDFKASDPIDNRLIEWLKRIQPQ